MHVDLGTALHMPGVHGYYDATNVPGDNHIGAIAHDEEVFATKEVFCVGQVIGIIVADTQVRSTSHWTLAWPPCPSLFGSLVRLLAS